MGCFTIGPAAAGSETPWSIQLKKKSGHVCVVIRSAEKVAKSINQQSPPAHKSVTKVQPTEWPFPNLCTANPGNSGITGLFYRVLFPRRARIRTPIYTVRSA